METKPLMSVLMPTYNGGSVLYQTLENVLSQSFVDYELIINDDCSSDNTEEIIKSFGDSRNRFSRNDMNLGYPGNLEACRNRASGDLLFLMGQDDILARDAILKTCQAFDLASDIGAVTRPFFWFDDDVRMPVRAVDQLSSDRDEVVRIHEDCTRVARVFHTVGQLSGLALKASYVDLPFHRDVFSCHVYPFASIMKSHPIAFLKDYTVAVRIGTSQCRSVSSIYEKSPLKSWAEMFTSVFHEDRFEMLRNRLVKDHAAKNYLGLVQIRNYGKCSWFFSIGSLVMPRCLRCASCRLVQESCSRQNGETHRIRAIRPMQYPSLGELVSGDRSGDRQ
jgi:glycosyltransferase involved in cell wall biosynthesis